MVLQAEAPLGVTGSKRARGTVVTLALSYEGTPYLYGGSDRSGMDCSGLVYRVYLSAMGIALPRTAAELFRFCEPIKPTSLQPGDLVFFNTTGPIAHVGIYEGEGRFIHSASEGTPTGVMESRLDDPYWRRSFAGAGRLLPPTEYLGLVLAAELGPTFGAESLFRGLSGSLCLAYPVGGIEPGVELRPEYDGTLGVTRVTGAISLGFGKNFRIFVGPALTLGTPVLHVASGDRTYEADRGLAATLGATWTPIRFRAAGQDWGLYTEIVLEGYGARADQSRDTYADMAAGIRASAGLRIRLGF